MISFNGMVFLVSIEGRVYRLKTTYNRERRAKENRNDPFDFNVVSAV